MPEPSRENLETNEEHLADEIRELEQVQLASWRTWAIALVVFAGLALIVGAFMIWEAANIAQMNKDRVAAASPAPMALRALNEGLQSDPRVFRWDPVAGAANYVVIVREAAADGETVVIRVVNEPLLTTTDVESANLSGGRFGWSIEARRSDGSRLGYGEGTFAID
jgi:hypothetical protein